MSVIWKTVMIIFVALADWTVLAQDRVVIDVGRAKVKKSVLALTPLKFFGAEKTPANIRLGQTLFDIISNDLNVSDYFTFLSPDAYLENVNEIGLRPRPVQSDGFDFAKWKTSGAEFLVRGAYRVNPPKIGLEIYAYDVNQGKLLFGKNYDTEISALRKLAHTFSNDLLFALTGKKGMFTTRITAACQKPGQKVKEICVMDWDAENSQTVTNHRSISTSPTWSPDGKKITYTALVKKAQKKTRSWDLFTYELDSGKRWLVSFKPGNNTGAAYTPDGRNLLLTMTFQGSADIYLMGADGQNPRNLTQGPMGALNVEPAVSPDGQRFAFSSTRGGLPMIYIKQIDGSGVKRVTFAGHYNSSPAWSPDGKKIAFAGRDRNSGGHFDIFLIDTEGAQLLRLTSALKPNGRAADNEDPSFSPDGRHIVFTSNRTMNNQLYIVSPDGTNERRLTHDQNSYFRPKWSGFLD